MLGVILLSACELLVDHQMYIIAEQVKSDNSRGHCVKYKFCFQWCESQGEPWWIPSEKGNTFYFLVIGSNGKVNIM